MPKQHEKGAEPQRKTNGSNSEFNSIGGKLLLIYSMTPVIGRTIARCNDGVASFLGQNKII